MKTRKNGRARSCMPGGSACPPEVALPVPKPGAEQQGASILRECRAAAKNCSTSFGNTFLHPLWGTGTVIRGTGNGKRNAPLQLQDELAERRAGEHTVKSDERKTLMKTNENAEIRGIAAGAHFVSMH